MKKLSLPSRIIIALASLSLIAAYFLPAWFIYLMAPQYPEGLTMYIWLDKINGQVEIINGLNHYIGMKHIKAEMFPEFSYLVYVLGAYILAGLAVAISGRKSWLSALILLSVAGGALAMYDFYQWGYDYGHNLDPTAAIQIPGFSYQPPLIGHKKLLNFDAYSYPDSGGWLIIGAATVYVLVWLFEWRRKKKSAVNSRIETNKAITGIAAILVVSMASCSTAPKKVQYGKDICEGCNMTIVDERYGAEVITKKGRTYLFDDAHCLQGFIKEGTVAREQFKEILFIDYLHKDKFVKASDAYFIKNPAFKSPMNSNVAAFSSKQEADKSAAAYQSPVLTWSELEKAL